MTQNGLPLTPSGTRATAAGMVRTAVPTTPIHCAAVAIDTLDAVSRALLVDVLGLSRQEAAVILDTLWGQA